MRCRQSPGSNKTLDFSTTAVERAFCFCAFQLSVRPSATRGRSEKARALAECWRFLPSSPFGFPELTGRTLHKLWGVWGDLSFRSSSFFRGPMASYKELFDLDLRVIPTEVLKAIYGQTLRELQKRRASTSLDTLHGSMFAALPNSKYHVTPHQGKYLDHLLAQDWSSLFAGSEDPRFYVYAHVRPSGKALKFQRDDMNMDFNGLPFYIGKGTGLRAFDLKRNQGHGALLRELTGQGVKASEIVHIVRDGMTEPDALALESKLIYFFGTKYESDRKGILVNLDIPERPELMPWKQWKKHVKPMDSTPRVSP